MQPEDPAQLGGKIYEMMGMALSGKWSSPPEIQHPVSSQPGIPETLEAEVVEPVEADGQKWEGRGRKEQMQFLLLHFHVSYAYIYLGGGLLRL